jgi:regulatory protein
VSARLAALRLLGRRDYTRHELADRLLAREHPPDEVEAALDALTAEGLVDDRRVAAAHARTASELKGRGRLRIMRELEARGIGRAVAQDAVARLSPEHEAATIERFLARKRLPARLPAADHRRIFAQLLRRGFSADAIAAVLRTRSEG